MTGSKTEIARLQSLVPQYRDLRVNLGRWKPLLTSDDPAERITPAAMLQKAAIWRDPQFDIVRKILSSAMMRIEVTEGDTVQVDVRGSETSITCIKNGVPMPATVAGLPIALIILDARSMTVEETGLIRGLPGRSKMP